MKKIFNRLCMLITLLLICKVMITPCSGMDRTIKSGFWEFSFNTSNGYWNYLKWKGSYVSVNKANKEPFNWGPGWPGGKDRQPELFYIQEHWVPDWSIVQGPVKYVLKKYSWDDKKTILKLYYRIGNWNVKEAIKFGSSVDKNLLARTLSITYAPSFISSDPALFANVILNMPVERKGRYFFPGKRAFFLNRGPESMLSFPKSGRKEATWCNILPLLLEQNSGQTAIFLPSPMKDLANMQILSDSNALTIQSNFKSYGWAYPGKTQIIGPAYLKMTDKCLERAFESSIWSLYYEIGMKRPANQAKWINDMILYCFYPGGSASGSSRDLGGFTGARLELLPRLQQLGVNTLWVQPVEEIGTYCPRDYYKINKSIGTAAEYRELITSAHSAGMKVIQGIVPHGGKPSFGPLRGNKPWELVFDKNGNALSYWCFDYANPNWQQYIAGVAEYYMKNFDIDGLRIDVADGSHQPNWRRNDFPSIKKTPKNVPEKWWRSELKKNGGKLPPIPYERASICRRLGGLGMIKAIRDAAQKIKPNNCVILGEVQEVPYMTEADIIYDMDFCHVFINKFMQEDSPADFASGVSRWLEQQKYTDLRNTLRMRYTGSHDSLRAKDIIGIGAAQATTALTFFIDGVPMIYQDADIGMGVYLNNLITLRKLLPELQKGSAEYLTVKVKPKSVFTCLRTLGSKVSVAFINFSPNEARVKAVIPATAIPLGKYTAWDSRNGNKLKIHSKKNGKTFNLTLGPWESAIAIFRNDSNACPIIKKSNDIVTSAKNVDSKIKIQKNKWGSVVITSPFYSLYIKGNGMIHSFADNNGNIIIDGSQLIYDSLFNQDHFQFKPDQKLTIKKKDYGYDIETTITLPISCKVKLIYRCMSEKVDIQATLEGVPKSRQVGFVLKSKETKRWQVNTAEGLLDDFFMTRHVYGVPYLNGGRTYRMQGSPILWQSKVLPMDLQSPEIRIFTANEKGASLTLKEPLENGLDNIMVLDKFNKELFWHAGYFWNNKHKLTNDSSSFTISLAINNKPLKANVAKKPFKIGDLSVSNESMGWRIKNKHYSIFLRKTGGAIHSLFSNSGQKIINKSDLFMCNGPVPQKATWNASADVDTGVKVWEEDGKLNLLFSGALRKAHKSWGSLLTPYIRFKTHYKFDNSSAFTVKYSVLADKGAKWNKPSLGIVTSLLSKENSFVNSSIIKKTEGETYNVVDKYSRVILVLEKIKSLNNKSLLDIFIKNKQLYIMWFNEDAKGLKSDIWHEASFSVQMKKRSDLHKIPIAWRAWAHKSIREANYSYKVKDNKFVFNIPKINNAKIWYVQFCKNMSLIAGRKYKLSFKLDTDKLGNIGLSYARIKPPWKMLGLSKSIRINAGRHTYSTFFTALKNEINVPSAIKFLLADLHGKVILYDIKIDKIKDK